MTGSMPRPSLGRHEFGAATVAFGVLTLVWHAGPVFEYAAAAAQIFGGIALQFNRIAKAGAVVLGAVYLAFALSAVPQIVATPRIYNAWGNFFEQFSLVTGATLVYARRERIGRIFFGICVASFTCEQAIYLRPTVQLVPHWLPPSQLFWAVATTVLFGLAAVALLTNLMTLLATRLLTMMLVMFGLLVWVPLLLANPHSHGNWSEAIETFAIAGVAWMLADLLGE
jgi:hypothetical protein